jgi:hypothetical protein
MGLSTATASARKPPDWRAHRSAQTPPRFKEAGALLDDAALIQDHQPSDTSFVRTQLTAHTSTLPSR